MLRIIPVQQNNASDLVQHIYQEIQEIFAIDTVPLLFQYLANYERYLDFIWDKMKANIHSEMFHTLSWNVKTFAEQKAGEFAISPTLDQFIAQLNTEEKEQITDTISYLERVNIQLMLLMLDIRESMKSVSIMTERLTTQAFYGRSNFTEYTQTKYYETTPASNKGKQLLAPLFGTNALISSHYADFFTQIAVEMERLKTTEAYLKKRVELEHLGLTSITQFTQPLGCSYQEFRRLTEDTLYVDDLVYVITDLFPSQFPNLVLTTALMQRILQPKNV